MKDRFCKERQPTGYPDCKVGVKLSTNQEQRDGSTKVVKNICGDTAAASFQLLLPTMGTLSWPNTPSPSMKVM